MRLDRLLHMSSRELADRSRQKLRALLERVPGHDATLRSDDAVQAISRGDRFRCFPGLLAADTPRFVRDAMPDEARRLRAVAARLLAGRFDLLGYRDLSFGDPIDWQLDPVSGRHAPLLHWSRIDPLDAGSVGDVKVTWELGRHQWLVTLAQTYALDRDERIAECALARLDDWLARNPVGYGIHWTSSLECALRVVSWTWAVGLLTSSPALSPERWARIVRGVAAHADHVEHYLSTYFSPNTHLTGEALGLLYAGTVLDGLSAAPRWRRLGADILARELGRQVADGVHFEQSTCYQRYTADIYLHAYLLTRDHAIGEAVQRMVDALLWLRRPDGRVPPIGDDDGGVLLPLSARIPGDASALFSTAAVVFGRGDYAWAARQLAPDTVWQLGAGAAGAFAVLPAAPPAASPSRQVGGWAVVRDSWADDAHQLVLDVGPLGCPISSGHGHADLLGLQLSCFGEPLLVDPGTFGYTAGAWRDAFRTSLCHTTLSIDGRSQAEPDGPFAWRQRPAAHLAHWVSRPGFEQIGGVHTAYGVVHRRTVTFAHGRSVVVDRVEGEGSHRIELRFQLAPGARVAQRGGWVRTTGAGGHGLDLRTFAPIPFAARVHEGELAPPLGWCSPDYGQRVPAPLVVFAASVRLPLTVVTVLVPRDVSKPCVESLAS